MIFMMAWVIMMFIEKERIENVKHEKNEFEVRNVKYEIHFFIQHP